MRDGGETLDKSGAACDAGTQIAAIRGEWGRKLLILGHHYQRSSVIRHADEIGDSLELSRKAAASSEAERIVFCGVRFMAESADILSARDRTVFMPEPGAGCPMAGMAGVADMETAWTRLEAAGGEWAPVVYVNSTADIKAACGRYGGSACTSSNAKLIFERFLAKGRKIFFLPDEHLGRNTARDLGIPDNEVALYDPGAGAPAENLKRAQVVVWKGFCLAHTAFTVAHVQKVRELLPKARIIVHPEVPEEVVRLCDAHGSTAQIIQAVEAAPDGATMVIGTEINLVQRLAEKHRGRVTVKALCPSVCASMSKTNERNLLALLETWPRENEIHVPESVAVDARKALERMLTGG